MKLSFEVDNFWKYLFGLVWTSSVFGNLIISKGLVSISIFAICVYAITNIRHAQKTNIINSE